MADILDFIPKDTTKVKLVHPVTGEVLSCDDGTEMFIEVYGSDSKKYRKIQADIARDRSGKKNQKLSPEQIDELVTDQLASCIAAWNLEYNGEKPVYSKSTAVEILSEVRWIREQVAEAINDRASFLQNVPTN